MEIINNILIKLKKICATIASFLVLYLTVNQNNCKTNKKYRKTVYNSKYSSIYKNKWAFDEDPDFFNFRDMLPFLYKNSNFYDIPFKKKDLFNARQIYISDNKITRDYIKFIRDINETKELQPKKLLKDKEIIIDSHIYEKRKDQYNYLDFCKLALNEKLIDEKEIKKDYKPIISIIIPTYNKEKILLKSIRSIQNQNFKNLEIIIVNDFSVDNSSKIFNYLIETDLRIRIIHHMKNLGVFRSRLDGILYSKGKYIILFDPGDFYEDNYVLSDAFNILEKYNLDSCKFVYRQIRNINKLNKSFISYHTSSKAKIVYEPYNIKTLDNLVFGKSHAIWNRLVRSIIYIKGILLLNELTLNVYKNFWDDWWFNEIVNMASHNFTIIERIGYIYYVDGKGEGIPKYHIKRQKSNSIREYVSFLYFDLNFNKSKENIVSIIKKLKNYNEIDNKKKLKNFISHFEVLNNLLEALIKDNQINEDDRKFCKKLLNESKIREKLLKVNTQ